jgi:membrane protease YdiL (CAAX protease family)
VREVVVVVSLFAFSCFEFLRIGGTSGGSIEARATACVVFLLLAGAYLGLSLEPVRRRLRGFVSRGPMWRAIGPATLLAAVGLSSIAAGSNVIRLVVPYAVYLLLPLALLSASRSPGGERAVRHLAVAIVLWLPIEFGWMHVRLGPRYDASHLVAVVMGLYCFLILDPIESLGYTFELRWRDWRAAVIALIVYLAIAVPIGLFTGFVAWNPQPNSETLLVAPPHIYLAIAVPEELLFRGVIQDALFRRLGAGRGLAAASIVFGLAHLPDPRYVFLAALAGVAYGWVFWRTERITASAVTHTAVDWIWRLAFQQDLPRF